ncbi:MAG: hypothetical protein ACYC6A_03940 [Armatimonadota bacterium]
MYTSHYSARNCYRSDGGVHIARFFIFSLLALAVAFGLAYMLQAALERGIYLMILFPAIAGLIAAGFVRLAIRQGHCRNGVLAIVLALVVGMVLYLGQFYIMFVNDVGLRYANRVDLLPKYIRFVVRNTETHEVGVSPRRHELPDPEWLKWGVFLFELGFVVVLCVGAAAGEPGKAYDRVRRRWYREVKKYYLPQVSEFFTEGLSVAALERLMEAEELPQNPQLQQVTVIVEYLLPQGDMGPAPVFFSLTHPKKFRRRTVPQVALLPEEIAVLAPKFRELEPFSPAPLPEPPPPNQVNLPAADRPSGAQSGARLIVLSGPHSGRAMTKSNMIVGNILSLLPLVGFFGGFGVVYYGSKLSHATLAVGTMMLPLGIIVIVLGIALSLLGLSLMIKPVKSGQLVYGRALRGEIASRPDAALNPHDPRAVLAEYIPRDRMTMLALENALDVGYLLVSPADRAITFEGDRGRYLLPIASLTDCRREDLVLKIGSQDVPKSYLILKGILEDGQPFELPFNMMNLAQPDAIKLIDHLLAQVAQVGELETAGSGAENTPPPKLIKLFNVKGFGLWVYGVRRVEPERVLFTTWLCLMFIPIIPLATWSARREELGWVGPVIGGVERHPHDHLYNLRTFVTALVIAVVVIAPVAYTIYTPGNRPMNTNEMIITIVSILIIVAVALFSQHHQFQQLERFIKGKRLLLGG